jgi:hypothetical protein
MNSKKFLKFLVFVIALFSLITASSLYPALAGDSWYKGNTHTHTYRSDGDSSPEAVAQWYFDHGYNFLVFTDHNMFDPEDLVDVSSWTHFILIAGGEITGRQWLRKGQDYESWSPVHTTAQNVTDMPDWSLDDATKANIIQFEVDGTIAAGGKPILAHPIWLNSQNEYDIFPVEELHMFEIYNGHPDAYWNYGTNGYPAQEELWDRLLTMGMEIYGVCADDTHTLTINHNPNTSGPGRGWVMVQADELTPDAITEAMDRGDFYSSYGVFLKTVFSDGKHYIVEADEKATQNEISQPHMFGSVRNAGKGPEGFKIEFIGPGGKVLKTNYSHKGEYRFKPQDAYVRCRVTYSRPSDDGFEEFFAWTQPIFTDGRVEGIRGAESP